MTVSRDEISLSKQMFETSPTFCVAIDAAGRTLMMNPAMLNALGYEHDEVIGKDYMSLFVPERDREALAQVFAALTVKREATVSENHVLTRRGSELLVEWHGRPVFNTAGDLDYFFGIGIEIGERRRMADALWRSEQRLELHVQQTPLGVVEWDTDTCVTSWNPAAEQIFGYTREEAMGRLRTVDLIPESARAHVADVWESLVSRTGGSRSTNENVTKDGRVIICEWYNTPLVGPDGEVIGVASLVNDVTELRRRERAQVETIERLSAPVIEVWEGILALPVIGAVDAARASRMTESLLESIVRHRARFTIVDLTGASELSAETATHLMAMIRAAQLLGTQCLVSGISPSMAQTLTELEASLGDIQTLSTLRAALAFALGRSAVVRRR